jgi:hypothetical protein
VRFIISITNPSIVATATYGSTSLDPYKIIGIHIVSANSLKAILTTSTGTFLATLDFSGLAYTLQKVLPQPFHTGIFSNDGSVFYMGTAYTIILANPTPIIMPFTKMLIYSSDDSCASYIKSSDPSTSGTIVNGIAPTLYVSSFLSFLTGGSMITFT